MYRFAVADKGDSGKGAVPAPTASGEKPRKAPKTGASDRIGADRISAYHEYTRTKGVNWPLYVIARAILVPAFLIWFRLERLGREHARVEGGLIVASNHRSFLDPFVLGALLPWRRPMHYVAKVELFEPAWQGWILSRLGAYPVRRGEADSETLETSRRILERGGALCIFPEGTRIRRGSLAVPHRGVGRLALETGAAVLPVAVHGSEHVRDGWKIRPRKVRLRAGKSLTFPQTEQPVALARRHGHHPDLAEHRAPVGVARRPAADAQGRGHRRRELGHRGRRPAGPRRGRGPARLPHRRAGRARSPPIARTPTCPGSPSPIRSRSSAPPTSRSRASISSASRCPRRRCPPRSVRSRTGSAPGPRCCCSARASCRRSGRSRASTSTSGSARRAVAALGGPAHAKEAASGTAALALASRDEDLRAQLGDVFDRAGLICERTADVVGVEMAGAAKNAASLAAAAAAPHGLNAAGIAAAEIWRECTAYAIMRGGELETFAGLAGVGDLTATILAPGSRNRRAGELLGSGVPAEQIPDRLGQASEGLDSVPLIAAAVEGAGVDAGGLSGLAALIDGDLTAVEWVEGLRRAERARTAA